MKELMSYKEFPPLQTPETYNLDGIIAEMKASKHCEPHGRVAARWASDVYRNGRPERVAQFNRRPQ